FAGGTPATSALQNPIVTYAVAGTYNVSLTATNAFGSNTSNQTNYITINEIPSITSTSPGSRCGMGTVTLGASATAGTISWFASASGGTALGTGAQFTTPSISTNTNYYVEVTSNGCTSERTSVLATVNTNPTVTNPGNQNVCVGNAINPINFTGNSANSIYSWTNSNTVIGLGASGSGNIGAFTPSTAGTSTISVTPTLATCTGATITFTINANPIPIVSLDLSTLSPPCVYDPAFALPAGTPTGGTYSGPGVSGTNFNPANAGTGTHTISYSVTQNGCTGSSTSTITVDACAGLNEYEQMQVIIYPNPSTGIFVVDQIDVTLTNKIYLYDQAGRLIKTLEPNSASIQLDLTDFSNGVYSLKFEGARDFTKRIEL
ncbi:MAG: T9SS type A sorting domain-containing protein, partial [Crocinitomicaceae bacterium]